MKDKIAAKVKDLKRDLILQEACRYFEEVGFENVKMNDLAKNCDISVGQLYKLFDSKENIFYEYIRFQIKQFYENLQKSCLHVEDPQARLVIYLKMKFDTLRVKRKAFEDQVIGDPLFFSKMNIKQKNPAIPIFEFLKVEFEKLAKKYNIQRDLDFLQIAYVFNSFSIGYIEYWLNHGGELKIDEKAVVNRFVNGFISK